MKLDAQTQALIDGIKQATGQEKEQIVKQAVENHAEELGKQLIIQQGNHAQQKQLQTDVDKEIEDE